MSSSDPYTRVYEPHEQRAVAVIVLAGFLSLTLPLILLLTVTLRTQHRYTHSVAYYISLLTANMLQGISSVMNLKWVSQGVVVPGNFCSAQGGIKQAGNIGTAIWSFVIAIHIFDILILRHEETRTGLIATLSLGWSLIGVFVLIGPAALQTVDKGPYFGVSGFWCWITEEYPLPRFYLEYFLEFLSAGLGFLLYTTILLRVRGNIYSFDGKLQFRYLPRGESWKLSLGRDMIDASMLRVSTHMVWYPVAYTFLLLPIAISRLSSFSGHNVPDWAIIFSGAVFNLSGLVNSILLLIIRRLLPDADTLPDFSTPRKEVNPTSSEGMNGVTPYILTLHENGEIKVGGSNSRRNEDSKLRVVP